MWRCALLAGAAALLPACGGENKIWVSNAGGVDALVQVRWWSAHELAGVSWTERHTDHWAVAPGRAAGEGYLASYVEVRILRASDDALLFEDEFDDGDFRDEHGRIEITVSP